MSFIYFYLINIIAGSPFASSTINHMPCPPLLFTCLPACVFSPHAARRQPTAHRSRPVFTCSAPVRARFGRGAAAVDKQWRLALMLAHMHPGPDAHGLALSEYWDCSYGETAGSIVHASCIVGMGQLYRGLAGVSLALMHPPSCPARGCAYTWAAVGGLAEASCRGRREGVDVDLMADLMACHLAPGLQRLGDTSHRR